MPKHPDLPLEEQAAIERARENINRHAVFTWRMLFGSERIALPLALSAGFLSDRPRKPASIKLELQQYSAALFDAEALYCLKHAGTEEELRSWLESLGLCIEAEVMALCNHNSHDFHCPHVERRKAISDGLMDRSEHWVNLKRAEVEVAKGPPIREEASPVPGRGRADFSTAPLALPKIEEKPPETIGDQIERLRLASDLTMEELAEKVEIDPTNVSRHIRGLAIPSIRVRKRYQKTFSKELDQKVILIKAQVKRRRNAAKSQRASE